MKSNGINKDTEGSIRGVRIRPVHKQFEFREKVYDFLLQGTNQTVQNKEEKEKAGEHCEHHFCPGRQPMRKLRVTLEICICESKEWERPSFYTCSLAAYICLLS